MSSDRELLEKAAKAARFQWNPTVSYEDGSLHGCFLDADAQEAWPWNPLTDDGDALRLAVGLGIAVYPPEDPADDATANAAGVESPWISEPTQGGDPYAATRRAIVRAAAALGSVS